jgi:DNA-binding transcriptional LysR family regulator
MEIRVLRYFLTVVREENISRAADVLHITQPTLSRQLAQLEEELGTQLFLQRFQKNHIDQ